MDYLTVAAEDWFCRMLCPLISQSVNNLSAACAVQLH